MPPATFPSRRRPPRTSRVSTCPPSWPAGTSWSTGTAAVLAEFHQALNPGGILIIDHRNFDSIRQHRYQSSGNYYYCGTGATVTVAHVDSQLCRFQYDFPDGGRHQLEVYPVLSAELSSLL